MFCWVDCDPTITNCIFSNNVSETKGGGLYFTSDCRPVISGCSISNNESTDGGGSWEEIRGIDAIAFLDKRYSGVAYGWYVGLIGGLEFRITVNSGSDWINISPDGSAPHGRYLLLQSSREDERYIYIATNNKIIRWTIGLK